VSDEHGGTPAHLLVDTDELRRAGNATLADSDHIETASHHVHMAGSSSYGSGSLNTAARQFSDRFSYALRQLAEDTDEAGRSLRGTAQAYDYMDTSAADQFNEMGNFG
jgi:hypothetical protein